MGSIKLVTEIPGPRSRELLQRAKQIVMPPIGPGGEIFIERGEGAVVEDVDANRYLDLIGGVGCLVTGHSHPKVVDAIRRQTGLFTHTDFTIVPYENYVELAERITSMTGPGTVAFFNTGAEAVENAVKVARYATGRPGVICFEGAFHGRTYMALTLTAREIPHKSGFGPFVPEVYRARYPGLDEANEKDSVADVEAILKERSVSAVIVEPVLGEGGFVVPPSGFLTELQRLCRDSQALLILDEVQSGYARTGKFLASQHEGVSGDLTVLGKSIASGLPLSALIAAPALADSLPENSLGGTYPGNPVACAAGLAVMDVIEQEGLLSRAVDIGKRLTAGWEEIAAASGAIREVRGVGAMIGVEFDQADAAKRMILGARERGVLAMSAGREGKVIRHLMPLVITDDQLDEALGVFSSISV